MSYIAALILFVIGSFIGLKFPDFDQTFRWYPVLLHRSILTHSFLAPLLFTCSVGALRKAASAPVRWFAMGLCGATAVHLCFDLFVRAWRGYALLHLPFFGWTTPFLSQVCFVVSAFVCLILAFRLLRNATELYVVFLGLIISYGTCAARQPYLSFGALVALVVTGFLALLIARPSYKSDSDALIRKFLDK